MIHYCTYFDRNYVTRALALYRSLRRHSGPFTLWALCLDDEAYEILQAMALEDIRPFRLADLEASDPELLAVKDSRSIVEYYFTCSPSLPRYLLGRHPEIERITYLDADLLFYSSPDPIFEELGNGSVLIVPHRFPASLKHLEVHGVYNVGLLTFRNDSNGLAVLERWRSECIEWCYDRVEDGRFADQRYLDAWPGLPGVVVLENPGAGLAPWNFMRYRIDLAHRPPTVDGKPLVFYHFQGLKAISRGLWDVALDRYAPMEHGLRSWLYGGYVRELQAAAALVRPIATRPGAHGQSLRQRRYSLRQIVGRVRRDQVIFSTRIRARQD